MALVLASVTPLLLLNEKLVVLAASVSFCSSFELETRAVIGAHLLELGGGEWNIPQLRSLLEATVSGNVDIDAYEFVLKRQGKPDLTLILNAHVLVLAAGEELRVALAITDITVARQSAITARNAARENAALASEKHVLLLELNHRVANSLQIIASILMQRARGIQSEETQLHLRDAHSRVMSIATLQRLLASTATDEVLLRTYLNDLCASITASMIADPAKLALNVIADESVMTPDRSVSLGLIITELVINSIKHAFPVLPQTGRIDVSFATTDEGWILTVADDGVGLPDDYDSSERGLGTGLVKALADQLSATVEIASSDRGTTVTVERGKFDDSDVQSADHGESRRMAVTEKAGKG